MPSTVRGARRAPAVTRPIALGALLTALASTLLLSSPAAAQVATTARPFDPPQTTRTVHIPTSIDATGNTNVRAALTNAIAAAPNGSIIAFPPGGIYRIDGKLNIGDRHDLVLDGNGSTLRIGATVGTAANSVIDIWAGSTDIVIREFKLVGNSPRPGSLIDGEEFAMGIHIDIATRVEIANVTIEAVYGDALTIDSWGKSIWFHDSRVRSAGRNGIGLLAGRHVIVERNRFDKVGLHAFDIEPYEASGGAIRIRLRNNTIRTYGTPGSDAGQWAIMFASQGVAGARVENVRVRGNTVEERSIQTRITSTTRRRDIWVTDNRSLVKQAPYYNSPAVLWFAHVDGLTVKGNSQPLSGGKLVSITDCTDVDRG